MSVRELELHDECVRLSDENKQLRAWLTNVLVQVALRDELVDLGRTEIEKRWPEPNCSMALNSSSERVAA